MYLKLFLIIGCSLFLFGEENATIKKIDEIFKQIKQIKIKNNNKIVENLGSCWYSVSNKPNEFAQIHIINSYKQIQVKILTYSPRLKAGDSGFKTMVAGI